LGVFAIFSFFFIKNYWKIFIIFLVYFATQIIIYLSSTNYIHSSAIPRFLIPTIIIYALLSGLGIVRFMFMIRKKFPKSERIINITAIIGIVLLIALNSYPQRLIKPHHEEHQMGIDLANACSSLPSNAALGFQDDIYNAMYFYCYPYLDGMIINTHSFPAENMTPLFGSDKRIFLAYKENLREEYDFQFDNFSRYYKLKKYFESENVDLYEVFS